MSWSQLLDWVPDLVVLCALPLLVLCLPIYLAWLRPNWIRLSFEANPRRARRLKACPEVRKIRARLAALGFKPLGVKLEHRPLFGGTRSLAYVSIEQNAYASVFRTEFRTIVHVVTPFEPQGFLITSNGRSTAWQEEAYSLQILPRATVDELLVSHQESVARYIEVGYRPQVAATREARLACSAAYYRYPPVRHHLRRLARQFTLFYAWAVFMIGHRAVKIWLA